MYKIILVLFVLASCSTETKYDQTLKKRDKLQEFEDSIQFKIDSINATR